MRTFLAVSIMTLAITARGGEPKQADASDDRTTIHLLDPRGAIDGSQTMPTGWKNLKADVIGMRRLNVGEAKRLLSLLRKELKDDDNVPFCGHSPAYAVSVTRTGQNNERLTTTVTLCGTCGTWAKNGDLRALHGKAALEYLDTLLPLPAVFRPVKGKPADLLSPFGGDRRIPFEQLDATVAN